MSKLVERLVIPGLLATVTLAVVLRANAKFQRDIEAARAEHAEMQAERDKALAKAEQMVVASQAGRAEWDKKVAAIESESQALAAENARIRDRLSKAQMVAVGTIGAAPGVDGEEASRSESDSTSAAENDVPTFGCQTIVTGWSVGESGVLAWTGIQRRWWRWPGGKLNWSDKTLGPSDLSLDAKAGWPPQCPAGNQQQRSSLVSVAGGRSLSLLAGRGLGGGGMIGAGISWRLFGSRWSVGPQASFVCVRGECDLIAAGVLTRYW